MSDTVKSRDTLTKRSDVADGPRVELEHVPYDSPPAETPTYQQEVIERRLRILARVAVRAYLRRRASGATDAADPE